MSDENPSKVLAGQEIEQEVSQRALEAEGSLQEAPKEQGRKEYPEWTPSNAPHQPWMCQAHRTTDGELCRKPAIKGATVCLHHGGGTPQVRAAAKARLEAMVPKANNALEELLDQTDHLPTRLGAIKEVHDRVLGPVRDTNRASSGVQIQIGLIGSAAQAMVSVNDESPQDADFIDVTAEDEDQD